MGAAQHQPRAGALPRVPAYAWAWLQRSRPVVAEAADRLTGRPPTADFVDGLRDRFAEDAFTRDVLIGCIADVAFGGRVPTRRPAGASWDRGLTWWAAALAGITPAEFDARATDQQVAQRRLFDPTHPPAPATSPPRRSERHALAAALRDLLASAGDQVPASAIRQLLDQLEES